MKIALLTDTHAGARNDSGAFSDYFSKFYEDIFFPELEKRDIKTMVHLGDAFDRRKYINFNTLTKMRTGIIQPLLDLGVHSHFIVGNHDTYWKSSNKLNAQTELLGVYDSPYLHIYDSPCEVRFGDLDVLVIPWINEENKDETQKLIDTTTCEVVMGHLEVTGFEMHQGFHNAKGMDPKAFSRFDKVMSGHFHHKSDNGTIHYLGAPYEMTWTDFQDPRGFHIFDTETRELEFIRNPYRMFRKIFYNDRGKSFGEVTGKDFSSYEGCYVKVIVQEKKNPYWFDLLLEKLYKANPANLTIVEEYVDVSTDLDVDEYVDRSTMTILHKYVESMEIDENKEQLQNLLKELHQEAVSMDIE